MLRIDDLTYRIAGRTVLEGATVHVPAGHKVGVVGRNGAGKTTLLRLIGGEAQADGGDIRARRGARIATLAQEAPGGSQSLTECVLAADEERSALLAEAETAEDPTRIAEIHQRLADIDAHGAPARAARILAGLGFSAEAQERPLDEFSGGWRMRVALARVLFLAPDLLLLDEPTNYLDLEGAIWLEGFLARYPYTLMIVSHDRVMLNKVADSILHVENQGLRLYRGGYDQFEAERRQRLELQEKARNKQEAQRKRMQAFVDRFRAQATKARQAQSRLKMLERLTPIAAVMEDRAIDLVLPEPEHLAPPILALDGVAVGYGTGPPVLSGLDLRLDMDDRVALLGRNGNGKTTLARLLAGELQSAAGKLHRTSKLRVGHFAQHQIDALDPEATAYQHMARRFPDLPEAQVRARIGAFGFAQDQANVVAEALSGGERARLVLALIAAERPHLLILDEPTNHLDVDTRHSLIQALNAFSGGVVLISHDRHLVELVADRLWLVADGGVRSFNGDMADYRALVLSEGRSGPATDGNGTPLSSDERKQARRRRAEKRRDLAPLRIAARTAEREVDRLSREKATLEAELARGAGDGEAMGTRYKRLAELDAALAAAERRWLAAEEAVQEATG